MIVHLPRRLRRKVRAQQKRALNDVRTDSMKAGPSEDYLALLRREIEPDEYVRRLKADVDARMRRR